MQQELIKLLSMRFHLFEFDLIQQRKLMRFLLLILAHFFNLILNSLKSDHSFFVKVFSLIHFVNLLVKISERHLYFALL